MVDPRNALLRGDRLKKSSGSVLLNFLPEAVAAFAVILGLLVLIAWYAHWTAVIQVFPNLPPMKFNTALGFVLCGVGLILLEKRPNFARWLGVAAGIVGLLTLAEYITASDFRIDQLFIRDDIEIATSFPGRMSPLAASCFTFFGIALVVATTVGHGSKARVTAVGLLACVVGMIACVSLFGYFFGIDVASGWGHYTRLALHTSLSFLLLGIGLSVWAWKAAHRIGFNFLRWVPVTASVTLMVMIAVISTVSFAHLSQANYWQKQSSAVIDGAQAILGDLTDTQRGMRGYILSGQPEALKLYQGAVNDLPVQLGLLQTLTSNNADQQSRLKLLSSSVEQVIAYSHRLLDARETSGVQGTVDIESKGEGLSVMNQARADLQAFTDEEHRLLDDRRKEADSDFENTKRLVILSTVLAGALLLLANLMASREVNFRRQAEADLHNVAATQQAILNSANHAIISVDAKGTILTFNETAEHWFGYSAAELIGKANPSIFHVPEEVVARAAVLSRELGREIKPGFETFVGKVGPGKPAESEWTFIRKDGSRFPVWLSISLMTDIAGKVVGYLGVVADLTTRKEMETALEKKSLLLDGILTNSLDGIIAYECIRDESRKIKDFRFTLVNPSAEKLSRKTASELIGRPLLEVFPNVVPDGLFEKFVRIANTGQTLEFEYCSSRTNPPRWYRVTGSKIGDGISISYMEITERRKVEETLRLSEERFRLIVDGVKDYALFMLSPDGHVISWNVGAERVKGYKATEIIGKHFSCFYSAEDLKARHPEDELRLAAKNGRYEEEGWRIRKDGTRFMAHVVITALYNDERVLQGFAKITRDVTEQHRSQSEILKLNDELEQRVSARTHDLSVSEQRFRFLAEAMPQIIWTARPDGSVDYFNQRWFEFTGMTMEQTKDWGWTPVLHPDDLQACLDQWKHACETGGKYDIEYRFKRASDGQYRWQLGRAFPLRDESGKITFWVGTCTDIDDLKRAEVAISKAKEELEKSELRFRTMADSIPQLSWIAQADGFINWYNRRWYEYTGTTSKDMEGWGWQSVHDPKTLPSVMTKWTASIASGEPFEMEFPLRGADGKFRAFLTRVLPFKNAEGEVVQWFGTNTDVDDLKQAEEKVRKTNEELEKRVQERTRELHEKNLELLKAAQAKNTFLANMSHELRTPLNGIIGFSEILADGLPGAVNADQKEYLGDILNSSHHLLQLINDVLDLAKVEAGKMELHTEAFSIRQSVEQVCSVISPLVMKKKIQLSTKIAPELDQVVLDQKRLKQILYNLLSNAIKFTDDQGLVEIMIAPSGTNKFTIAVKDSGIGIRPENLKRLFQEFEQLDEGTTRRYQGTGLGLALTRKISEMQGGSIKVESEFGKGTTFTVTLPLILEEVVT